MRGSRGGAGGPDPLPLVNHKARGFLSNSCPDPLENHKATRSAQSEAIIVPAPNRHLNGVSLAGR